MTRFLIPALIAVATITLAGCNQTTAATPRAKAVVAEAQLMSAETASPTNPATFNEQKECSAAAKAWWRNNYGAFDKDSLLEHSNHFNHKLNRCFIRIIWETTNSLGFIDFHTVIYDVMEDREYARFDPLMQCRVRPETWCHPMTEREEFNKLAGPLMYD